MYTGRSASRSITASRVASAVLLLTFVTRKSGTFQKESTDTRIREVAQNLSVPLMTEEEVAAFSTEVKLKNKNV